jgi:hypothetical protein
MHCQGRRCPPASGLLRSQRSLEFWIFVDNRVDREFLVELRRITQGLGAFLIFDEVITGLRLAPGGGQEFFGVGSMFWMHTTRGPVKSVRDVRKGHQFATPG